MPILVLFMVAVIGLFAHEYMLQSVQVNSTESGLAQTIETWHDSASFVVHATPLVNAATAAGCSLNNLDVGTVMCKDTGGDQVSLARLLPLAFQTSQYSFSTIVYQTNPAGPLYLITYVTPGADGNLYMANGYSTGYSGSALLKQVQSLNLNLSSTAIIGLVEPAGKLTSTQHMPGGGWLSYDVPTTIRPGSVAMMSVAN